MSEGMSEGMNDEAEREDLPAKDSPPDERPPFGRSWTTLYAVVVINLLVHIALFYIFTKAFE